MVQILMYGWTLNDTRVRAIDFLHSRKSVHSFTVLYLRFHTCIFWLPWWLRSKNPPTSAGDVQETQVPSLGWEDPLEKEMATHSSILAWRIPWTEEPGGLQSMGSQRVRHNWSDWTHTHTHTPSYSTSHRSCATVVCI